MTRSFKFVQLSPTGQLYRFSKNFWKNGGENRWEIQANWAYYL